jgi:hypothetical protein
VPADLAAGPLVPRLKGSSPQFGPRVRYALGIHRPGARGELSRLVSQRVEPQEAVLRSKEGFMYRKLARVLLPLIVLAIIATMTIASSCCFPQMNLGGVQIGQFCI